jgi:hypothetical protein
MVAGDVSANNIRGRWRVESRAAVRPCLITWRNARSASEGSHETGDVMTTDRQQTATKPNVIPVPWAFAAMTALGLLAVLVLPTLGSSLDREGKAAVSAATALVILVLTGLYVFAVFRKTGWQRSTALLTYGFLAGIAVIKFIVSPGAFYNTTGVTLSEYLWLGAGVMLLYLAGLFLLYWIALHYRDRPWPLLAKVAVIIGLLLFAVASRFVAAGVLAPDVSEYLDDVFRGGGLWLIALLAGSLTAAVQAFDRAGRELAFRVGACTVVVYHGLWAVFMFQLFD